MFLHQRHGMATLKEIQMRLKSITNIAKITKSMKMIASTKVPKAQRSLEPARSFAKSVEEFATLTEMKSLEPDFVVVVSSDRGLCGGIHSNVSRQVRKIKNASLVVLGDKARVQLSRDLRDRIKLSFNQVGKNVPTFYDASLIADKILSEFQSAKSAKIVYNKFKSAIAYETETIPIYPPCAIDQESLLSFDFSRQEMDNFGKFLFVSSLFSAMVEGYASEVSARRTAMDNATKNAGDIIDRLTMSYNRQRQASITNDLVDIITGASAV